MPINASLPALGRMCREAPRTIGEEGSPLPAACASRANELQYRSVCSFSVDEMQLPSTREPGEVQSLRGRLMLDGLVHPFRSGVRYIRSAVRYNRTFGNDEPIEESP